MTPPETFERRIYQSCDAGHTRYPTAVMPTAGKGLGQVVSGGSKGDSTRILSDELVWRRFHIQRTSARALDIVCWLLSCCCRSYRCPHVGGFEQEGVKDDFVIE